MVLKTGKEIWKKHPEKDFEDKYEISNLGRVKNIKTQNCLKEGLRDGYKSCSYYLNDSKSKGFKTHRLVARLFVDNPKPDEYKIVNHIDGDKFNNCASNLEWCSATMNNAHAIESGLKILNKRAVVVLDMEKEEPVDWFPTLSAALDATGVSPGQASLVLSGVKESAGKYFFCYDDDKDNVNMKNKTIDLLEYKQLVDMPIYLINKVGNIYSLRFKKFMKYGPHKEGSMQTTLNKNGKSCTVLAHRMVASYFLKRTDPTHNSIRFKDGNKKNFHVDNLEWCHVGGVQSPEIHYDQKYYNPKTAIPLPKVIRNRAKP